MKVLFMGREGIYQILSFYFQHLNVQPRVAELGVLRGHNAKVMYETLNPSHMYLVDSWSVPNANSQLEKYWFVSDIDPKVQRYYGGSLDDPETYERLFRETAERFRDKNNVHINRENTISGFKYLEKIGERDKLDFIYVDANHEYEDVFWELMNYKFLLSDIGCIQLNDCCHSEKGLEQNLGVLEAVAKFCKSATFRPALLTNTDWSDVLLVRTDTPHANLIDQITEQSDAPWVEIPDQLLGAARISGHGRKNVSFFR